MKIKNTISLFLVICIVFSGLILNAQSIDEAPNSYIFTGKDNSTLDVDGLYIPVKKAYDMWAGGRYMDNVTANGTGTGNFSPIVTGQAVSVSVYWEDKFGLIKDVTLDTSNGTDENARIKVEIDKSKGFGNAVIALHKGATPMTDNVLWSWHVWVTEDPSNGVTFKKQAYTSIDQSSIINTDVAKDINGNVFSEKYMDRNLGAIGKNIYGENWHKSGGLMYQWGRKDPFPPMTYRDLSNYPVFSLHGKLTISDFNGYAPTELIRIPRQNRVSDKIRMNIQYSIKNPLTYIESSNNVYNWFSAQSRDEDRASAARFKFYDLWGDYSAGDVGAGGPPTFVKQHFKYSEKSAFDPCPNGWRVPTALHAAAWPNNSFYYPFGAHTDNVNSTNVIAGEEHKYVNGVKFYPSMGIEYTDAKYKSNGSISMNMGNFPLNGKFNEFVNNAGYEFTDVHSEARVHYGTQSANGHSRGFFTLNDTERYAVQNNGISGAYGYTPMIDGKVDGAGGVRCMQDPNYTINSLNVYDTQYFTNLNSYEFKDGLDFPNSYLVNSTSNTNKNWVLTIPITKAFSVYNQYIRPDGNLTTELLNPAVSALWSDNPNLIESVTLTNGTSPNGTIEIIIKGNEYGNAIIAFHKDGIAQDNIAWSWHIWAVENNVNEVSYTTESAIVPTNVSSPDFDNNIVNQTVSGFPPLTTTFMDRNLGALKEFSSTIAADELNETFGMYYQWGRKDPLTLSSSTQSLTFNSNDFEEQEVEALESTINNPIIYIDNGAMAKDWISDDHYNYGIDRWGHGQDKSPFDPCPNGWRVPDVTFVHNALTTVFINGVATSRGKGTSPWYLATGTTHNRPGLNQSGYQSITNAPVNSATNHYIGNEITDSSLNTIGWEFNSTDYSIGNFPSSSRREDGTTVNSNLSGIWTAALSEFYTGNALALMFDKSTNRMATGIAINNQTTPKMAMNVRCAKHHDDQPNLGQFGANSNISPISYRVPTSAVNDGHTLVESSVLVTNENQFANSIRVYPNPTKNYVTLESMDSKIKSWELTSVSGKMVKSDNNTNNSTIRISLKTVVAGVYILKSKLDNGKEITNKLIKY